MRRSVRETQDDDPGIIRGVEPGRIAEIQIKSNQGASFVPAEIDQAPVTGGAESLAGHGGHIMIGPPQALGSARGEVLVEFELQLSVPVGSSTLRSRDISAP